MIKENSIFRPYPRTPVSVRFYSGGFFFLFRYSRRPARRRGVFRRKNDIAREKINVLARCGRPCAEQQPLHERKTSGRYWRDVRKKKKKNIYIRERERERKKKLFSSYCIYIYIRIHVSYIGRLPNRNYYTFDGRKPPSSSSSRNIRSDEKRFRYIKTFSIIYCILFTPHERTVRTKCGHRRLRSLVRSCA